MPEKNQHRPLVLVENVRKAYNGETVLRLHQYTLYPGEIVAVCGGNGAGKSTLIKMLAGITQPNEGRIVVNGQTYPGEQLAYADQIGYMPDDFQAALPLTVAEFLTFYAELRRQPAQRVDQLLQKVGLMEEREKKISQLSKGMRQRLLLAQALLADPPLLLLDEPTNGLDPIWIHTFGRICLALKEKGQTILFSTHDLLLARDVADRLLFLHQGQVVEEGTVPQLIQKHGTDDFHRLFHTLVLALEKKERH